MSRPARLVDVLVVGGGITGTGVALDAASRGLSVVLAEKHDLAFGTSRWSSKLVHGGLRYLASGDIAVARESAIERHILMSRTAPHLVRALPQLIPLHDEVTSVQACLIRTGLLGGDLLRALARTPRSLLPRSRRVSPSEAMAYMPAVRHAGLRSGLLSWDGQLEDDARLVVALARTAAFHGASILTRCSAQEVSGSGAVLRDELTGETYNVDARAVINATGVWAGQITPEVKVRPSRGTHLVVRATTLDAPRAGLTVPVEGVGRYVFALPAPDGRIHIGLTDVDAPGEIPDVPSGTEDEIDFLLSAINPALRVPLTRDDLVGTYSGLRPLLDDGQNRTADVSRKHAVLSSPSGVITIVGGKLTTYRRMAQDAVDTAILQSSLNAGPCRTQDLGLVGSSDPESAITTVPTRLLRRYGSEANKVLETAEGDPELLAPISPAIPTTRAEFLFALRHEGAIDADDLLDRRTRIGVVQTDRQDAKTAALQAIAAHDSSA